MTADSPRPPDYQAFVGVFEKLARQYGAALMAVGWPNASDLVRRFDVMFAIAPPEGRFSLLDVGCGPGFALDYLKARGWLDRVDYLGVDISPVMVDMAHRSWPLYHFEVRDIISSPLPPAKFDYAIINGVCTGRHHLSHQDMDLFVRTLTRSVWDSTRLGMTWNVMSTHVDWEREDLFHWPMDVAFAFCKAELSRHTSIRADYGLWEYSIQVRRDPEPGSVPVPQRWIIGTGVLERDPSRSN